MVNARGIAGMHTVYPCRRSILISAQVPGNLSGDRGVTTYMCTDVWARFGVVELQTYSPAIEHIVQ